MGHGGSAALSGGRSGCRGANPLRAPPPTGVQPWHRRPACSPCGARSRRSYSEASGQRQFDSPQNGG